MSSDKTKSQRYHHGDLKAALLRAAEEILVQQGPEKLTLRAAARKAGVSHAAPKNHFGNLEGLLSELAASGFRRFAAALQKAGQASAALREENPRRDPEIGRAYVLFAIRNPQLFMLMFRSTKVSYERPALREASRNAFQRLTGMVAPENPEISAPFSEPGQSSGRSITPDLAFALATAWAGVHGLAFLLIDGRLDWLLGELEMDEETWVSAYFGA